MDAAPRAIPGLAALARSYDGFLVDLWGVIHDGAAAFPEAVATLAQLAAAGKRVVILSNAPRLSGAARARLRALGVEDRLYATLITSGDAVRAALRHRDTPFYAALGRRYRFLGKPEDEAVLEGLGYSPVPTVADADFVLASGLAVGPHGPRSVADYEGVLEAAAAQREPRANDGSVPAAAARGLPMVCANPDLAVVHGGAREDCAGTLAARYAALGGRVAYEGKPWPRVYRMALAALGVADRRRVLAVGDGLATDIAGAAAAGLPSLLVTGGLLAARWATPRAAPPDPALLAAALAEAAVTPTFTAPTFAW